MISQIFLVVIASFAVSVEEDACPKGWTRYRGHCYSVGQTISDYREAYEECEAQDAYLVEITSAEENTFVKNLIRNSTLNETGAFIGLLGSVYQSQNLAANQYEFGAIWVWEYSFEEVNFTSWADPGVRLDYYESHVCAALSRDRDWAWVAEDCYSYLGRTYVCEKDADVQKCFQGSCYRLLSKSFELFEGYSVCQEVGGFLVEINSQAENDFVKDYLESKFIPRSRFGASLSQNVWLGAINEGGFGRNFNWMSTNETVDFQNWGNDVEVTGAVENCAVLDTTIDYMWSDVSCFTDNAVLCETKM
ncbi:C-type mannose receptor 2 [Elysia marginata]|uniref:C-type mannose receptor 2 n=1 Tax=Elysia marginata TaxID=1093978 RepID=A0AAV4HQP2_9GAST|nr:C-type mannose receptor 2 [Elysia marginata]